MKRTLATIVVFLFAQITFAKTTISNATPVPTTSTSSGASINNTAKKSSSSANIMQMADIAAAAGFAYQCATVMPPPAKPPWCMAALATAAMASQMGKGKGSADNVDRATDGSGYGNYSGGGPGGGGDSGSTAGPGYGAGSAGNYTDTKLAQIKDDLAKQGYTMSPDGSSVTLPDGSTQNVADLAKNPAFQMDDASKAKADKIMEDAVKQSGAHISAVGTTDGGGGGLQPLAATDQGSSSKFDMSKYLKGLQKRDPASVSGLSKKLGTDNIGIKSDNIFEMVTRQYKRKQSQNSFLN